MNADAKIKQPNGQTVWAGAYYEIRFQKGTSKDSGVNGCQVEDILDVSLRQLRKLNQELPCIENAAALVGIESAINALNDRTTKRREQEVEGTLNPHKS